MGREAGSCGWEPLSEKCLQGTAEPGESFGPSIKEVNGEQSTKSTLQKGRDFCKPRAEEGHLGRDPGASSISGHSKAVRGSDGVHGKVQDETL